MNPRKEGYCDCGARLGEIQRDREWERAATQSIAGDLADVSSLNAMAERRADAGASVYGHDFPALDRDLEREAMEELADCRNYIIWRLDGLRRDLYDDDDEDRVRDLHMALKGLAQVFEAVRKARR